MILPDPLTGSALGFQVVLADLQAASATFRRESATFKAIMPQGGRLCPDGGSPAINTALQDSLQIIGWLHDLAAQVIGEHADKLQAASDSYSSTDTSLAKLAGDLTRAAGG